MRQSDLDRFMNRVVKVGGRYNKCWIIKTNQLYPRATYKGKTYQATYVSWKLHTMKRKSEHSRLKQICGNTHCVRPDHIKEK